MSVPTGHGVCLLWFLMFLQTAAEMVAAEARDAELALLLAAAAREEAARVASGGPVHCTCGRHLHVELSSGESHRLAATPKRSVV